jgi:ABC-2 type transport system permease protein
MPPWLHALARFNPLTYLVDALRAVMLPGEAAPAAWGTDLAVLAMVFALLWALAVRLYPGLVR